MSVAGGGPAGKGVAGGGAAGQGPAGAAMARQPRTFSVLSREWCHLCHDLVAALEPIAKEYGWAIEVIDIDQHPELEERWDELVPVLLAGETELCHYHLDEAAVRAYCDDFPLESRA